MRTQVRVLERAGDDYRVIHEAVVVAPAFHVRSFTLVICRGRVGYVTPAPATVPTCLR